MARRRRRRPQDTTQWAICGECGEFGRVEESITVSRGALVRLGCGHVQKQYDEGDETMDRQPTMPMQQHSCKSCDTTFMTCLTGAQAMFCFGCREEFQIQTDGDAEEIIQLIDCGVLIPAAAPAIQQRKTQQARQRGPQAVVPHVPATPAVKVDPAVVLAAIRATVDHQVAPVTAYTKPVTYVTAKNGLFEVRHSDLLTIISKPKEVLGVQQELQEGFILNIPKLPFLMLQQTISFFRGVCQQQKGASEAIVQIWWDLQEKRHQIFIPEQQVSAASVHHQSDFDRTNEGRWLHVADIHSHGGMDAFWSGTDNADEERVTTERLFGVIGKVQQPMPNWKWRMRTKDRFIDLSMADIFDIPKREVNFHIDSEALFRSLENKDAYKDGKVLLSCPVDPFADVEVPAEWYAKVKDRSRGGWQGGRGWEQGRVPPMKGFIYVDNVEYEVEDRILKPTGFKITTKKGDTHDKR